MDDLKLQSSQKTQLGRPAKWEEKFVLKRIGDDDLELSLPERNGILMALNKGDRFIQIRKYTLMLNSVKSIEPMWGEKNIPPRPQLSESSVFNEKRQVYEIVCDNQDELDEWDRVFGDEH